MKIAVAAVALIGLMSGGVYAVTKSGVSALIGRETSKGESIFNNGHEVRLIKRAIPGWPQTMIDILAKNALQR